MILTLLYDSGCRVQELCDLTIADIFLEVNPTVRLHGKGDKYRTVVISRHSKAMHMLTAEINIVYIRDFLGHEDISSTMVYVKADNHPKNEAIYKLTTKVTNEANLPDWNKDRSFGFF